MLSGEFNVGMGDKLDTTKGMALRPGGFVEAPAKMHHFGWTTSDTVVQITGPGPFGLFYVNPADDRVRSSNAVARELGPGPYLHW